MAAVGIGLGVVGLIGYQSMKDGALEQASRVAEKVATDAASRHMENIRQSVEGLQSGDVHQDVEPTRSEEHTSELQSLMSISYAVFCLIKKHNQKTHI